MILVWGISQDGPLRAIREALARESEGLLMLDQFDVARSDMSFDEADVSDGWLMVGGERIDLASVTAVYPRPYETARVLRAAGEVDLEAAQHAARFDDTMLLWLELTPSLVVNLPSAMTSNGSKPLQSAIIASAGFDVPDTLLTTAAEAAVEFRERHGRVIYKSIGGVRSRVSLLKDEALGRIANGASPIQLQEYIPGTDLRVHVVGNEVFACTIESDAVDYRYPSTEPEQPRIEACSLPAEISDRCVALTRLLGLSLAGIDLRRASDGRWVCFEANPSPGYTFYEQATGAEITAALARLLRGREN
jgi:glutathione synthase/RimK-type ligase-like ATP-grasp enzyme